MIQTTTEVAQKNEQLARKFRVRADWCEDGVAYAGALALLVGLMMLGYEVARWLQTGIWDPTTTWALGRAVLDISWLESPRTWLSLHRLVTGFLGWPTYLTYPLLGWLTAWLTLAIVRSDAEERLKKLDAQ